MSLSLSSIINTVDHFWYPEIIKNLKTIEKDSTLAIVEVDVNKIYKLRKKNCSSYMKVFFFKIFHKLKMVFSAKYRDKLKRGYKILSHSINIAIQLKNKDDPIDHLKADSFLTPQKASRKSVTLEIRV